MNHEFRLVIKIDENNVIFSDCYEVATNEKLLPYYASGSQGDFIGNIRNAYDEIIQKVKDHCCSKNVFKSEYAQFIIDYVKKEYHDDLEYLWKKFPNNAIWRNQVNQKWYGALLVVEKTKIDIPEAGTVEIIDLLMEPERIEALVDHKKYFKGYHMNKKHWITIKLDGSVDIKEICDLLDHSYLLSKNK